MHPACNNLFEGRAMVAARKNNRIVQIGMQGRTIAHKQRAMDLLRSGAIGQVYMARGICYKRRHASRSHRLRALSRMAPATGGRGAQRSGFQISAISRTKLSIGRSPSTRCGLTSRSVVWPGR